MTQMQKRPGGNRPSPDNITTTTADTPEHTARGTRYRRPLLAERSVWRGQSWRCAANLRKAVAA